MQLVRIEEAELVVIYDFSCFAYRIYHSKADNEGLALIERMLGHLTHLAGIKIAVILALDSPFLRKKAILSHYKAHRPKLDRDPKEIYQHVIDALPFYQASCLGEEADDVICTLVEQYRDKKIMLVTGDSDAIHLMDRPNVLVISEQTGKEWNENKFIKDGYYKLSHISAFKVLFGDTSDNVKPIWPRLQKKLFREAIWLYSDDRKTFIDAVMKILKEKVELSDEEINTAKMTMFGNYDLVIPNFNLKVELKEPELTDANHLIEIHPSLFFLLPFLGGETCREAVYEK